MGRKAVDMTGMFFGRLEVIEKRNSSNKGAIWLCRCSCGKEKEIARRSLISGETVSCGCFRSERMTVHGHYGIPEYQIWCLMKDRCYNEKSTFYENYGGRGIVVCDRWKNSFENFLEDMGERPSEAHSIERVNIGEGYSPENCTWADRYVQSWNRRTFKSNTSGKTGVSWDNRTGKWTAYISFNGTRKFLGYFEDFEKAVEERKRAEILYSGQEKNT